MESFDKFYMAITTMTAIEIQNLIAFTTAIIAIFALIYQTRATKKQIKLQNFIEFTKRYQEIILNFPESINDTNFSIDGLPEDQKNKTLRYMRVYFDLCFEEYTLYKKGFIETDIWEIWRGGMSFAFSKPAFRQAWQKITTDTEFGNEFVGFVENSMENIR